MNDNSALFKDVYKKYWEKVFRLAMGYVNNEAEAQDLTQETFIKVWENLSSFRKEAAIGTWVFRIASNTCLRQIENHKRKHHINIPKDIAAEYPDNFDEEVAFLYRSISELEELDRLIISLELEDVRQSDIASIMGVSEVNIRVRVHRIKEKLSKKFKKYER